MSTTLAESFNYILAQTIASGSLFLPRIVGALVAFTVGAIIAKLIKRVSYQILRAIRFSKIVDKTPLSFALEREELGVKIEEIITNIFYWLTMLVVIHTTVTILGLSSLTVLLERILAYIPRVISAVFVLAFGVLLAGWIEALIKNALKTIDPKTSRLMGKISGYLIVSLVILTALSELGIASEFITILFVGLVGALTLGIGLAIGLGGQDLVKRLLDEWYHNNIHGGVSEQPKKKLKK